jgi:peptide/nickel transport system permease protein
MVAGSQTGPQSHAQEIIDRDSDVEIEVMSQRQLIWRRFKRHRLAMGATVIVLLFYVIVVFADVLATNDPEDSDADRQYTPPQWLRLFDGFKPDLHVCRLVGSRDQFLRKVYVSDCDQKVDVQIFARGFEYSLLGLKLDRHLLGVNDPEVTAEDAIFILGTDVQGRDLYSRLMRGTRLSLLIGLTGIFISLIVGTMLGAVSGYYGGFIDNLIQRSIEIIRSIPTVPLYLGLAAAFPADWSVERRFFAITVVVSLFAWTELARVVRGRYLAMRQEDFVTAAIVAGANQRRIIFRHMLPSFYSHIIAASTLNLAFMVISETTLSFLGLGLLPPAISYGTMLFTAQNVQTVALAPWLLIPGIFVVVLVLSLNFMGDGIRDAADPYGS